MPQHDRRAPAERADLDDPAGRPDARGGVAQPLGLVRAQPALDAGGAV
jgi:hypothetical protein